MGLSDDERAMIDFERAWWKYASAKETEVRRRWGISSTVYYLRLNALLERPEALAYDPMTVRRLVRLREIRRLARSARRTG